MFVIKQIFNNNAALIQIDEQSQAVAKGKGIAFEKKKGDFVDVKQIEKLFTLDSETSIKNLYFLLKDIPIDVVTATYEIIQMVREDYGIKVLDYIYITIGDHIYGVYRRYKDGKYQESMFPDFSKEYPTEYKVAEKALNIVNRSLEISLPKSEIKNLALHFINAGGEVEEERELNEQRDAKALVDIVKTVLTNHGICRKNSSEDYYDRLMIHLQYLIERILESKGTQAMISSQIVADVRRNYPESFEIATEIFNEVKEKLNRDVGIDEHFYFIIHIQRIISEMPLNNKI
ncbi:PRD domain-containing protein [Enterococcus faecalis]|uniref:PRD domain-containing protein n=1 Tax=Enterococcus TaxID=1350 RepID=UPI000CF1793F|nr:MULTISPECIES: PRD domain-containing protein [Enterococcus]EME8106055.1 PRD domain-containing protein [Enterococcus faecium]EHZ2966224.1 PRD domain-containing protein [Enterococcus faecalis]EJJ1464765.1 PRD domain-containing protein [Enterococcus faecalis]EME5462527.1 PRD domain-containing protein [Enterococcus faecalis]MDT2524612.1 PRD domain-containing protein [Enterococcus raffinosus]